MKNKSFLMAFVVTCCLMVFFEGINLFAQNNTSAKSSSDNKNDKLYTIKGKIVNKSELTKYLTKASCVQLIKIPNDSIIENGSVCKFNANANNGVFQLTSAEAKGIIGVDGSFIIKAKNLREGKYLLGVQELEIGAKKYFGWQAYYFVEKSTLESQCKGIEYTIIIVSMKATGNPIIIDPQYNLLMDLGLLNGCSLKGRLEAWPGSNGGLIQH